MKLKVMKKVKRKFSLRWSEKLLILSVIRLSVNLVLTQILRPQTWNLMLRKLLKRDNKLKKKWEMQHNSRSRTLLHKWRKKLFGVQQ